MRRAESILLHKMFIQSQQQITNEMHKTLLRLVEKFGNDWPTINAQFEDIFDCKLAFPQLLQNIINKNKPAERPAVQVTKDDYAYIWLCTLKACSSQRSVRSLWAETKSQIRFEAEGIKKEFLKMFIKGLLNLNQVLGVERQKNAEVCKNLYDQTIFNGILMVRYDSDDHAYTAMKHNFVKMITLLTYVNISQSLSGEAIKGFCTEFEQIINNLQELNYMCFLNGIQEKSSGFGNGKTFKQMNPKIIMKIQKSKIYKKLYLAPSFDPFSDNPQKQPKLNEYREEPVAQCIIDEQESKCQSILTKAMALLPNQITVEFKTEYQLKDQVLREIIEISANDRLKQDETPLYRQILKSVQQLIKSSAAEIKLVFKDFLKTLPFEYDKHDQMNPIDNLEKLQIGQPIVEQQTFEPQAGELTLIQFWTSWSGFCHKNMRENLEILKEFKVRYVAISMDDQQEDFSESAKEFPTIEHYRFSTGWDTNNAVIRGLNIVSLPYFVLINEKQEIQYKGHPRSAQLQQTLQELTKVEGIIFKKLEPKEKTKKKKKKSNDEISKDSQSKMGESHSHDGQSLSDIPHDDEKNSVIAQDNKEENAIQEEPQQVSEQDEEVSNDEKNENEKQDQDNNQEDNQEQSDDDDDEDDEDDEEDQESEDTVILDEENFEELKDCLQSTLIDEVQMIESDGLTISLTERVTFKKDDQDQIVQEVIERSKLEIDYSLPVSEKKHIEDLITQIKRDIGEDKCIIIKDEIIDSQQEIRNKISEIFYKYDKIEISFHQQQSNTLTWNYDSWEEDEEEGEITITVSENYNIDKVITAKEEIESEYMNTLDENSKYYCQEILYKILQLCQLKPGMNFAPISGYENAKGHQDKIELKRNISYIICYFNRESQNVVSDIVQIKIDRKLGDKYKIYALNLDYDKERKNEAHKNLQKQQCTVLYPQSKEHKPNQIDFIQYGYQECPQIIVVNQEGVILSTEARTPEEVVTLLSKGYVPPKKVKDVNFTDDNVDQLRDSLEDLVNWLENEKFGDQYCFQLKMIIKYQIQLGQKDETKKYLRPTLEYTIRDYQLGRLKSFLSKFYKFIHLDQWNIEETLLKTTKIDNFVNAKKKCAVCQEDMNHQVPQYYAPFKKEYVCIKCAEEDDQTKVGYERFKYKDTLVYINAPLKKFNVLEHIDDYKFGTNLKVPEGEEFNTYHDFGCNGCHDACEGPRYICISCRPGTLHDGGYVDFCCRCFEFLKNRKCEEYRRMIRDNEDSGMTEDFLLLRVIFNTGYYNF